MKPLSAAAIRRIAMQAGFHSVTGPAGESLISPPGHAVETYLRFGELVMQAVTRERNLPSEYDEISAALSPLPLTEDHP